MAETLSQDATTLFQLSRNVWTDEMVYIKQLGWDDTRYLNARIELTDAGYLKSRFRARAEAVEIKRCPLSE